MNKLGLLIIGLIFGATAALAGFIAYTIIWNSSPPDLIELIHTLETFIK
ncbi:hypothetical protein [Sulfuracidifex metallicus]|jgi:hypothetical protein|nr:hypothetical protein [Sulfuracidifex metallicus]MCY0850981.1 hypothetical protein [Sulfuracidifex metallicus]WOE50544.1 hypothetical protein RQ359_002079 [Sulfuracidifex metallicus DSM 6482 = JCM 9184]